MPKALPKRFTDQAAARQHLEGLLWPSGPVCPHCGVVNEATALKGQSYPSWRLLVQCLPEAF